MSSAWAKNKGKRDAAKRKRRKSREQVRAAHKTHLLLEARAKRRGELGLQMLLAASGVLQEPT